MAGPCNVNTIACCGSSLSIITLTDRRALDTWIDRQWLFQLDLERVLYGNDTTTGAVYRLLARANVQSEVLTLRRADVAAGLVTRGEWEQLLALRGDRGPRVRTIALVPVEVVAVAARTFGQSSQATALLHALALPIPWKAEEEVHVPSPPPEAIEPEEAEEIDVPLEDELQHDDAAEPAEEEETAFEHSYALASVPEAVTADFDSYAAHRTAPINRLRESGACIHHTVRNDRANALRFLGWLHATTGIAPSLDVFAERRLGEWVEAYLAFLKSRGLRQSSMANYTSCLLNVVQYVRDVGRASADVDIVAEVLRLRNQCERNAKSERMYAPSTAHNWIDWEVAQHGRIQAIDAWRAHASSFDAPISAKETLLLRDVLIMLFHTVQPPDRVGVVRKLRLGHTLKRGGKHGYVLDLTAPNAHKTARFYGPTATSISKLIVPWLHRYLDVATLHEQDAPYLFHPKGLPSRALSPSQWCAVVKACFAKHTGIACSPKQLRASFVTWLKSQTDAPGVLRAAAVSMRHQERTQGSSHYDAERNDRLVDAAVQLCEDYARKFPSTSLTGGTGPAPNRANHRGHSTRNASDMTTPSDPSALSDDDDYIIPRAHSPARDKPCDASAAAPPRSDDSPSKSGIATPPLTDGDPLQCKIRFQCQRLPATSDQAPAGDTPPGLMQVLPSTASDIDGKSTPPQDATDGKTTPPPRVGAPAGDPPPPPARATAHEEREGSKKARLLEV